MHFCKRQDEDARIACGKSTGDAVKEAANLAAIAVKAVLAANHEVAALVVVEPILQNAQTLKS